MIDDLFDDEFTEVTTGHFELRDRQFQKEIIHNAVIGQNSFNKIVIVDGVDFIDCEIGGSFASFGQVAFRNVTIQNVKCKAFRFTAETSFDNVKFIGGRKSLLFVNHAMFNEGENIGKYRDGIELSHPVSEDGLCLDVTEFEGMVSIYHARPQNIRLNKDRHFAAHIDKLSAVPENDPLYSIPAFDRIKWLAKDSSTGYLIESILGKNKAITDEVRSVVKELRRRELIE